MAISFSKTRGVIMLAVVFAVVMGSYWPVFKSGFVYWDDDVHLYENVTLQTLDGEHVRAIFKGTVNKIYIPLTTLSFALEYYFFGDQPFIYHLDNVLLHLTVVGLIFALGLRLGLSLLGGAMAALLFGIHPMHVESVAWITERKDVLYASFYLGALVTYARYLIFTRSTQALIIRPRYGFLGLTFIFGILSMLAKPMALSLPLNLFLLDWFFRRKMDRRILLEKLPLMTVLAGTALVTYTAHMRNPIHDLGQSCLIWAWTFVFYLRQFLFPAFFVPLYPLAKPVSLGNPEYAFSILTMACLIWSMIRFRASRWFIFAILYYFFSIFFLLRFDEAKDANIVADRFMYLPSLGFCFLWGAICERAWGRVKWRGGILVVGIFLYGLLAVRNFQQCQVWRDSISLWSHQLKIYPDEPIALNNLAAALREERVYQAAEEMYRNYLKVKKGREPIELSPTILEQIKRVDFVRELYGRAIEIQPNFMDSYYNLGNFFKDLGEIPEAIAAYKSALSIDEQFMNAHLSLGDLYQDAGDVQQAIYAYGQTLSVDPHNEDAYVAVISGYNRGIKKNPGNRDFQDARGKALAGYLQLIERSSPRATSFFNLGCLYAEMGDIEKAMRAYQEALRINPKHSKSIYNMGNIYRDAGRIDDAKKAYEQSVALDPKNAEAYINIGVIFVRQGNLKEARKSFQSALRADPDNARGFFNMAYIEEKEGDFNGAIEGYLKSADLDPGNREVYYNLGNIYAQIGKNEAAFEFFGKATEIDPEYLDAWINLSITAFKLGRFKEAVQFCDQAILLGYLPPASYAAALAPYR